MTPARKPIYRTQMKRDEAAAYLEKLADSLEGGTVNLSAGESVVSLAVPKIAKLHLVAVEHSDTGKLDVEITFTGDEDTTDSEHLIY